MPRFFFINIHKYTLNIRQIYTIKIKIIIDRAFLLFNVLKDVKLIFGLASEG